MHTYRNDNDMMINRKKSKVMTFNPGRRKTDFKPCITFEGHNLDNVEQQRILGLIISSDMNFQANTDAICARAAKKLWICRRLKQIGANINELKDVYCKQVRAHLENLVPVWHSFLTVVICSSEV